MKQTVTSKYEPKSKNVTWIDMSTGSPVLKNFINGMWRPTGGGGNGAGSSNPTEVDATKVWQVTPVQKGTKTEETVIVPEQTLVNGQELEYNDKFVPGAQCVATIDGVKYSGEVEYDDGFYIFHCTDIFGFEADTNSNLFQFYANDSGEYSIELSVIEEVPDYDYNWAPGVKIPIPTAEDEGKILVVTKVTDESSVSTIVPEQEVPADTETPLTNVNLTKFVAGNTVKVTVSDNSQTFTATGVIVEEQSIPGVMFDIQELHDKFWIAKIIEISLMTNAFQLGLTNSTIKLEYIEPNYEYQLQENNGGGGSSNILHCEGSDDTHGIITAYIDSSELDNPQITTIAVNKGNNTAYFYRMNNNSWLVSGFNSFSDSSEWIKEWNTEGPYPTIYAYFYNR